jgi:hypothetical protein
MSPVKGMILASITICRPFFTASCSTAGRDRQPETSNPANRNESSGFGDGHRLNRRTVSMRAFFAFCTRCSAVQCSADYILKQRAAVFKGLIILPFDYSKVLDKKNVG